MPTNDYNTVELPFRPCPQSTMICPKCFKQFKIVESCHGGWRITKSFYESLRYYYDSCRCLYGTSMNHANASQFDFYRGESYLYHDQNHECVTEALGMVQPGLGSEADALPLEVSGLVC